MVVAICGVVMPSSVAATGLSQWGQLPPIPIRVMKVPQFSQRWFPRARVSQLAHSYTVIGRLGVCFGIVMVVVLMSRRRRYATALHASEQYFWRPWVVNGLVHTGQFIVTLS